MAKRKLVILAEIYNPLKYKVEASFMSEKLDGVRALWLPFTHGMRFSSVPWANRKRDERDYICSGLWSRKGKPFQAPDWFLDGLPKDIPLDGELFKGRNLFNETVSTVREIEPNDEKWQDIEYMVFDIPSYEMFFRPGQIREGGKAGDPAYEVEFKADWPNLFPGLRESPFWKARRFSDSLTLMKRLQDQPWFYEDSPISVVEQIQLPATRQAAEEVVQTTLERITTEGGEGLMLRRGHSLWEPIVSADLCKVKKLRDSEAQVIGYVLGEGKLADKVGAFRLRWNSVIFDLSGFTDRERELTTEANQREWTPGEYTTENISKHFPIGTAITFLYNDVTPDGKPKFARYWRKAELI